MNTTTLNFNSLMPLIMHSGRLADPLDPASQMLKKLTDKMRGGLAIDLDRWQP